MASSSSSSSSCARFSSSISPSSSSPSLSILHTKRARPRTLPRRGQIKAKIFASIFASIVRFLGAKKPEKSENGGSPQDGVGSCTPMSNLRMDEEGGLSADEGGAFRLSVGSSNVSNWSGSVTPSSPFKPLLGPRSFHEAMHRQG